MGPSQVLGWRIIPRGREREGQPLVFPSGGKSNILVFPAQPRSPQGGQGGVIKGRNQTGSLTPAASLCSRLHSRARLEAGKKRGTKAGDRARCPEGGACWGWQQQPPILKAGIVSYILAAPSVWGCGTGAQRG